LIVLFLSVPVSSWLRTWKKSAGHEKNRHPFRTAVTEAFDQPISTVFSRRKKLKALAEEFLDCTLIF